MIEVCCMCLHVTHKTRGMAAAAQAGDVVRVAQLNGPRPIKLVLSVVDHSS